MAIASSISFSTVIHHLFHNRHQSSPPSLSFPASNFSIPNPHRSPSLSICSSSSSSSSSSPSSSSSSRNRNKKTSTAKKKKKNDNKKGKGSDDWKDLSSLSDFEIVVKAKEEEDDNDAGAGIHRSSTYLPPSTPTPLPKPPAGFAVSDSGRVSLTSDNRIATIADAMNNNPLDCVVRRVFTSSKGDECMLLCPVDMPVHILKSMNIDGWSQISDDEVEAVLPDAAYALAKIDMHLVHSGFCLTTRGTFCYSDDDIFDFRTGDSQNVDGLPTEGVEVTDFHFDGAHYMIYTPSDPLLFIAIKDQDGVLQIADDDVLEDPAVVRAIDEETEFNALVEAEAALMGSAISKSRIQSS